MATKNKQKNKKNEKDTALLDAYEKFAVENREIPKLQEIISNYVSKNDVLKVRYNDIKEKIQQIKKENFELVNQFQKENTLKGSKYEQLQDEFQALKEQNTKKITALENEKRADIQKLEEEFHYQLSDKEKRIDELKNMKLGNYEDIKKRENELLSKVETLKKQNENSELSHHDKMRDLEKNFLKQANNIESIHKAKTEKTLKNASSSAHQLVLEKEKNTEGQNKHLTLEMRKYQKELESLKKERSQFIGENKIFTREIAIAEEGLEQYHKFNQNQNEKIKQTKEKIEFLKNFISVEVIKYTKDLELEKHKHQALMKEYNSQIDALKQHLQESATELKTLRILSKKILQQREDIEDFFLDSIEQLKSTQSVKKSFDQGENTQNYSERVDISQLNLEDREKILRIIFAKINNGVPPISD